MGGGQGLGGAVRRGVIVGWGVVVGWGAIVGPWNFGWMQVDNFSWGWDVKTEFIGVEFKIVWGYIWKLKRFSSFMEEFEFWFLFFLNLVKIMIYNLFTMLNIKITHKKFPSFRAILFQFSQRCLFTLFKQCFYIPRTNLNFKNAIIYCNI